MLQIFSTKLINSRTEHRKKGDITLKNCLQQFEGQGLIANFSQEWGLADSLPIYSGGLGVLEGDLLKTAAQKKLPMLGIGLLYWEGFFKQRIKNGEFVSEPQHWNPYKTDNLYLTSREGQVEILDIFGTLLPLKFLVWLYLVKNPKHGFTLPLLLLDGRHPENYEWVQNFTRGLYDSTDVAFKIVQRYLLGVGGMRLLAGLQNEYGLHILKYHLNEGHAAMAIPEFLNIYKDSPDKTDRISDYFSGAIHTPVSAGLDIFLTEDLSHILPATFVQNLQVLDSHDPNSVNLPYIMKSVNPRRIVGVSRVHGHTLQALFPELSRNEDYITNGIYLGPGGWQTNEIRRALNKEIPATAWQENPELLKNYLDFALQQQQFRKTLRWAHQRRKNILINYLNDPANKQIYPADAPFFVEDVLTIGFARRFALYKRADLLFQQTEGLVQLARETKARYGHGLQFILAGKAHPKDEAARALAHRVLRCIEKLNQQHAEYLGLKFVIDYNMDTAKKLISGSDFWLNTPMSPLESSGTSFMKANANGVICISTRDGSILESTPGSAILFGEFVPDRTEKDIANSYLQDAVPLIQEALPQAIQLYYAEPVRMLDMMITALFENSSLFNTSRMLQEYAQRLWGLTQFI